MHKFFLIHKFIIIIIIESVTNKGFLVFISREKDISLEMHFFLDKFTKEARRKGTTCNGPSILSLASGSWLMAIIFTIQAVCH